MLENVPHPIGRALQGVRAGETKVAYRSEEMSGIPQTIAVSSPAFPDGGEIPVRFTADGDRLSPPLDWRGAPDEAVSLVLLVEDPDAPMPEPLVHCIAWDLPSRAGGLAEGELKSPGAGGAGHDLGHNAFLKAEYLPPDPPPGHGPHRYMFQLYALDTRLDLDGSPGRRNVLEAMRGHVLARGLLVGTYQRP